ncbi:4'-phosphopantetheinyl transferase family protein [Paludifilum halophilum]|uniref:Uncharacterized protein n=1 Tax=Paludifilum halophilum TaxID=1642702 RepID=A0A235B9X4_9BACL|nr:4'-phosphopantetheinyl transferase superfamily protein [Paludifilum halophilum]OYD09094.1 hypothetical protein CHM34_04835 [Paludifilum halophilum]
MLIPVDTFYVKMPTDVKKNELEHYLHWLTREETLRYERYIPARKMEFITGRVLMKKVLAAYLDVSPFKIQFRANRFGKLFIDGVHTTNIGFNLSHSRRMMVLSCSKKRNIGVDVQYIWDDHLEVMSKVFTDAEIDQIEQCKRKEDQLRTFTLLWTRKEAVMKATGRGFSLSPQSFSVPTDWGKCKVGDWFYISFPLQSDYVVTIALESQNHEKQNGPIRERVKQIPFETLFAGKTR